MFVFFFRRIIFLISIHVYINHCVKRSSQGDFCLTRAWYSWCHFNCFCNIVRQYHISSYHMLMTGADFFNELQRFNKVFVKTFSHTTDIYANFIILCVPKQISCDIFVRNIASKFKQLNVRVKVYQELVFCRRRPLRGRSEEAYTSDVWNQFLACQHQRFFFSVLYIYSYNLM